MSEHGFPITRKVLKKLVVEILKTSGQQTIVNLESGPSDAWGMSNVYVQCICFGIKEESYRVFFI